MTNTPDINIPMHFVPDVALVNQFLNQLKTSMGSAGKDIKLIDETAFKKSAEEAKKASTALGGYEDKLKGLGKTSETVGNTMGRAFQFTMITQGINAATQALDQLSQPFVKFEASLADMSAITGVSGDALAKFGDMAKDMAGKFGGDAVGQIDAFKGILSRLGPDIAKSPEALERMTLAVNTMAKASGLDAKASMDALTTGMLQFNVSLDDPIAASQEMTKMMNVMAAGAKEGAAEIPQVADAIKVAGVAASGAKLSFEETNAAIQVMAAGGKYGSEAGTALRNVLTMLQAPSGAAEKAMKGLGTSSKELGKILTTQGLGPAIEMLKSKMVGLDAQAKNVALAEIFGAENSSAAGILIQRSDMIADLTAKMTGTNTAFEQAAINMDTTAGAIDRFKAKVSNALTGAFSQLGSGITIVSSSLQTLAPSMTALAGIKTIFPSEAIASVKNYISAAGGIAPAMSGAMTAFRAMSLAFLTNPFTLAIAGAAALGVAIYALTGGFKDTSTEVLKTVQAEGQLIASNLADAESRKKSTKTKLDALEAFKKLSAASTGSTEDNKKLNDEVKRLNDAYPGLNLLLNDNEGNLRKVTQAATNTSQSYDKIAASIVNMSKAQKENTKEEFAQKANVALDDLVDVWKKAKGMFQDGQGKIESDIRLKGEAMMKAASLSDPDAKYNAIENVREQFRQMLKSYNQIDDATKVALKKSLETVVTATEERNKMFAADGVVAKPENKVDDTDTKKAATDKEENDKKLIAAQQKTTDFLKGIRDDLNNDNLESDKKKYQKAIDLLGNYNKEVLKEDSLAMSERLAQSQVISEEILISKRDMEIAGAKKTTKDLLVKKKEEFDKLTIVTKENRAEYEAWVKTQEDKLQENIIDIKSKYNDDIATSNIEFQQKINDEILKEQEKALKKQVKLLLDQAKLIDSNTKDNLDKKRALQIEALDLEYADVLGNIDDLTEAQLLKRNEYYDKLAIVDQKYNRNLLNLISDNEERKKQIQLSEIDKTYSDSIQKAEGSYQLELEAYIQMVNAKAKVEEEFGIKKNLLFTTSMSLIEGFTASFKEISATTKAVDQAKIDSLIRDKTDLKAQEDALKESLNNREISQKDYLDKMTELQQKNADIEKQITDARADTELSFWKKVEQAAVKAFEAMEKKSSETMALLSTEYFGFTTQKTNAEKASNDAIIAMNNAIQSGTQADIDKAVAEWQKAEDAKTAASEGATSKLVDITVAGTTKLGMAWGKLAVEQKISMKSMLVTLLDSFEAMIPILVAEIFGQSFAQLGPIGGAIASGLTIGVFTALAEAGKSAIQSANFAKGGENPWGGVGLNLGYGLTSPGMKQIFINETTASEYIVNPLATKKLVSDLDMMNAQNISVEEHIFRNRPDIIAKIKADIERNRIAKEVRTGAKFFREHEVMYVNSDGKLIKELTSKIDILTNEVSELRKERKQNDSSQKFYDKETLRSSRNAVETLETISDNTKERSYKGRI